MELKALRMTVTPMWCHPGLMEVRFRVEGHDQEASFQETYTEDHLTSFYDHITATMVKRMKQMLLNPGPKDEEPTS